MHRLRLLLQLILGDFRERTRRYSFLLTVLGSLFFGYLVITGKYSIQFNDYRSIENSAWIGTMMAVTCSIMFSIVGFYLVKNSISRDRRTEVGQIIAATPITKFEYLAAKFVSNYLVLMSMVGVLMVVAFFTLVFRGETGTIDLWVFIVPFFLIPAPTMALVAAAAVFFDTVRWLRGSLGNVIYLFMAEIMLVMGIIKANPFDPAGVQLFLGSARAAVEQAFPGVKIGMQMGFIGLVEDLRVTASNTFLWEGVDWSLEIVLLRSVWIGVACCVVVFAVPFFDRFDPAQTKRKTDSKKASSISTDRRIKDDGAAPAIAYDQISAVPPVFSFIRMLTAELYLMLKGFHWLWYLIAAILMAAQWAAPFDIARLYILPLSMVWPLVIWSAMGTRESRFNTGQLMFSSPMPFARQFPALWLAGLAVAVASVGGMTLRAIIIGQWEYAGTLLVGALFVSSMALVMGTLSGSKKIFEVIYLTIWYVGSIDHVAALDLLGTTEASITGSKLIILLLLSAGFLIAASLSRRKQVYG